MTARRWRRFACTPFARGWNVSAPPPGPLPGFGEAELTKEEYDKRVDAYEAKSKAGGLDDGAPRGCQDGSWGPSSISSPIKPPLSMRRVWEEVCREVWTDGRRPPHGGTENGSWWGWAGGGGSGCRSGGCSSCLLAASNPAATPWPWSPSMHRGFTPTTRSRGQACIDWRPVAGTVKEECELWVSGTEQYCEYPRPSFDEHHTRGTSMPAPSHYYLPFRGCSA